MPQLRTSPISTRMYRHFAVITVALTALIAVFADGERRQAAASGFADRQQANALHAAETEKFGKPKLIRRNPRSSYQGLADSYDPDYGRPMEDSPVSYVGGGGASTRRVSTGAVPSSYAPYGIDRSEWLAMSDEERAEFLRARGISSLGVSEAQHQRQVDRLLADSAARSGSSSD